jgi:REP element-mobilizing transposase RayT
MGQRNPQAPNPGLDRTRHQLRASGVIEESHNPLRCGIHTRGYLPHVKREGASYFVTFRLADSLPREVLLGFERERAERLRRLDKFAQRGESCHDSREAIARDVHRLLERYLDRGAGACHLRRPDIAKLVAEALRYFHPDRYLLREWVVMPNHVHAVVWPAPNQLLGDILRSWKQFTSRRAKELLGLGDAPFWQPESYDHWIRNDQERARIAHYITHNPVTAKLCARPEDWHWSSAWHPPPSL